MSIWMDPFFFLSFIIEELGDICELICADFQYELSIGSLVCEMIVSNLFKCIHQ